MSPYDKESFLSGIGESIRVPLEKRVVELEQALLPFAAQWELFRQSGVVDSDQVSDYSLASVGCADSLKKAWDVLHREAGPETPVSDPLTACLKCAHVVITVYEGDLCKVSPSTEFDALRGRRRWRRCQDVNTDGHCPLYLESHREEKAR